MTYFIQIAYAILILLLSDKSMGLQIQKIFHFFYIWNAATAFLILLFAAFVLYVIRKQEQLGIKNIPPKEDAKMFAKNMLERALRPISLSMLSFMIHKYTPADAYFVNELGEGIQFLILCFIGLFGYFFATRSKFIFKIERNKKG